MEEKEHGKEGEDLKEEEVEKEPEQKEVEIKEKLKEIQFSVESRIPSVLVPLPNNDTLESTPAPDCQSKKDFFHTKPFFFGSKFPSERRKINFFWTEATQYLTTINEYFGSFRSITLRNKVYPSQDEDTVRDFTGKLENLDEEEELAKRSSISGTIQLVVLSLPVRYERLQTKNARRMFSIFLLLLHVVLLTVALINTPTGSRLPFHFRALFLAFCTFFLLDVMAQAFVEGLKSYFSSVINIIDLFGILLVLTLDILYINFYIEGTSHLPRLTFILKGIRLFVLIRVFKLARGKRKFEKAIRKMVSENKRRYKKDGFDLDLTYVTDNVIAMSFPSSGRESFYRNPIKEVVKFLDLKHRDHYKIYNLCSEKTYNPSFFHNRVERFPIDDHNVPSIIDMLKFVDSVFEWMEQDSENVIVVHCLGGKGRTGTMICIWLIASEQFETAKESLEYFGKRRTDLTSGTKYQGVETPSQSRYVEYFALIKNKYNWTVPQKRMLQIRAIIIYSIQGVGRGDGSDLKISVIANKRQVFSCKFSSSKNCQVFCHENVDSITVKFSDCPNIYGDVKIKFFSSSAIPKLYDKCSFFFWFNTAFIDNNRLYLSRNELDNPHKQKTWNIYRENFAVELLF
uniref:Phosphatidylinositol 3,4,5-trisphosphate 3-phosphatase TPTE2-like n=1 Tax=Monodelphis domestica TaxID=13616 RepID=F7AUS6_MONDO